MRIDSTVPVLLAFALLLGSPWAINAAERVALGPFAGIGEPGTIAIPSRASATAVSSQSIPNQYVRRRYASDPGTIQFLKTHPAPFSTAPSIQVQDSGPSIEELAAKAPSQPAGFQGITNTGHFPPDNGLAAGPNHIVEMVNSSWRVFTKAGVAATALRPFCGSGGWWTSKLPAGVTSCFDPHVLYDQLSDRWVMTATAQSESLRGSWYLIATSFSADPTGSWCTYALDATLDGATKTSNWADFPALGLDDQAIYITSNQFNFSNSLEQFQYVKLRTLGKQQFYNNTCQAVSWADLTHLQNPDGSDAFSVIPAQTFGSPGIEYLLSSRDSSGSDITVWSLTNPLANPPSLSSASIQSASYNLPPNAEQCGNATPLDTGDARLLNVVYRNGTLWTSHTIACPADNSKACLGLIHINPSNSTLLDDFVYGNYASGFHYFYPAVMIDAANNLYVVFNSSSVQQCVGLQLTGRPYNSASNSLQSSTQFKASTASYVQLDTDGTNRWGDYSGIAADPASANSVWVAGEYASNTNTWATWIANASFGTLPPADFDGDGKSDIGIYRNGAWSIKRSSDGGNTIIGWGGAAQDIPVPQDYDGDGKADIAIYRNGAWSIVRSSDGGNTVVGWGGAAQDIPVPRDYDGDGKADIAIYRDGAWSILRSSDGGNTVVGWGGAVQDILVPADYDGDGKADIAIYRDGTWSILRSSDGGNTIAGWGGVAGDVPVPADYDGDGKADIAIYRSGAWSILRSSDGGITTVAWGGGPQDIPVPADYDGDGKADIAIYRANIGQWIIKRSSDGGTTVLNWGGAPQDIPLN